MRRFIDRLARGWSGPRRGLAAIASGTLLGQGILALSTPFLSRIYSPEDFGRFSAILAVAGVVGPAAALKFDAAIMLPRDVDEARRLFRLAFGTSVLVSVASVGCMGLAESVGLGKAWEGVAYAPFWVGAMVLATGTFTVLTQAALRQRDYVAVAKRSVTQSLGVVAGQWGLGLAGFSSAGLLAGFMLGRCVGYAPMIRAMGELRRRPSRGGYRRLVREYWRFPVVFTPSGLLNALGTQAPLLIISWWYGTESAGQLGMAQRLAFIPATLLGMSMGNVFGAELSRIMREDLGSARRLYMRVSIRMGAVAAITGLVLVGLGPWAMPWVLGGSWHESGQHLQALALSVSLGLVASPVSRVYTIYQASVASILVDSSRILLIAAAFLIVRGTGAGAVEATWLLYGAQAVNYVLTWLYGLRIVSRYDVRTEE